MWHCVSLQTSHARPYTNTSQVNNKATYAARISLHFSYLRLLVRLALSHNTLSTISAKVTVELVLELRATSSCSLTTSSTLPPDYMLPDSQNSNLTRWELNDFGADTPDTFWGYCVLTSSHGPGLIRPNVT